MGPRLRILIGVIAIVSAVGAIGGPAAAQIDPGDLDGPPPGPAMVRELTVEFTERGHALVRWLPPLDDGDAPVVRYQYIVLAPSGGIPGYTGVPAYTTETSFVATGVPGEPLTIVVAAVDALGRIGPYAGVDVRLPLGSGYWLLDRTGRAVPFGDAPALEVPALPAGVTAVAVSTNPGAVGLSVLGSDGAVRNVGTVEFGPNEQLVMAAGESPVAIWSRWRRPEAYWTVTDRGQVASFGTARHFGDVGTLALRGPVVDGVGTASGAGYLLAASDGGVFAFGDAVFSGSMGGQRLNAPVVGIAADPDGRGYWLAAADGGVFAFDAPFLGSMGGTPLQAPVVGIEAYGDGYVLVARDGGVFVFGTAPFHGSLAGASGGDAGGAVVATAAFADPMVVP